MFNRIFLSLLKSTWMDKSVFDLESQNNNLTSKIVVAFEKIAESFRVMLWEKAKEFGLSPIQIQLLIFLKTHHERYCKISYLAKEFNMTKATVSDAIRVLESKGLISKEKDPNDTRSSLLHLTKQGEKNVSTFINFSEGLENVVNQLSDKEKEQTWLHLAFILKGLGSSGIISLQRMCFSCAHYKKDGASHYCSLLKKKLTETDIRVDCPDHLVS